MQKSEEKEGNKRRKKGKENIWERRETGRKGKKEGRGGLAWRRRESQTTSQEMNDTHEE